MSAESIQSDVVIEHSGDGVGLLVLARPERNNAIRPAGLVQISQALDKLAADESVRAIVVAARGKHFSSGADFEFLEDLKEASPLTIQDTVYTQAQGAMRRLYNCRKPTVAAVSGAAVTLGCELALACDFRVVSQTAFFQETWIRIGLLPPLGGLFLLPRLVGAGLAAEMVLQGRQVRAEEAVRIGLAREMVEPEALLDRAIELARELAALPPQAYRLAKAGLHRGFESGMEQEWAANASAQAILISSEDFAEGLEAVKQKRKARFLGR
jgi:enoyl-CoA hydratase/carnithine racemase